MTRDELRRLAIRLARHTDAEGSGFCGECEAPALFDDPEHAPDCPIAALEAEEAASKAKPAGEFEGEFGNGKY